MLDFRRLLGTSPLIIEVRSQHQDLCRPTSIGQKEDRLRAKGGEDHPEVRHLPEENRRDNGSHEALEIIPK